MFLVDLMLVFPGPKLNFAIPLLRLNADMYSRHRRSMPQQKFQKYNSADLRRVKDAFYRPNFAEMIIPKCMNYDLHIRHCLSLTQKNYHIKYIGGVQLLLGVVSLIPSQRKVCALSTG